MSDGGGFNYGVNGKSLDYGYILKGQAIEFNDSLDVGHKRQ